ncbi:SprB repeat-containing protein [Candidatus Dependentiae bacterium]|nr:SprB repeat-containing protein [Candidatus Dependentiae bacterium]
MKNRLLVSLLLINVSSWYCFAALPLRVVQIDQEPAPCPQGEQDEIGSVRITIEGGETPYFYSVNGSSFIEVPGFELVYTNVPHSYTFAIRDSGDLVTTATTRIGASQPFEITIVDVVNNGGTDQSAGSITLTTTGGISPTLLSLNGGRFNSSKEFTGLAPEIYTLRAINAHEVATTCPTATMIEVSGVVPPEAINVVPVNVSSNGGNDGKVFIDVSGGVGPFEYSVKGGSSFQSSSVFSNIPVGNYEIVVKDATGLVFPFPDNPVIISQQEELVITNVTVRDVTSAEASNGTILVETNRTDPGMKYSLAFGTPQTSPLFTDLQPGTYRVIAFLNSFCAEKKVNVGTPAPTFDFTTTIVTHPSGTDTLGSVRIAVRGGTGPFTSSIDNGTTFQESPVFTGLLAGIYTVVVRDTTGARVAHTVSLGTL